MFFKITDLLICLSRYFYLAKNFIDNYLLNIIPNTH